MLRRLFAIVVVAALSAPGTWIRSPAPEPLIRRAASHDWKLEFIPMRADVRRVGELEFVGAWQLESNYPAFGSYSALVSLGDGRLLAASDTGHSLIFAPPGSLSHEAPVFDYFAGRAVADKFLVDIEAVTRDPASGRIWAAFEGSNAIVRYDADWSHMRQVRPLAMRDWPGNTGPETMVRLQDGRFLVLSESRSNWYGNLHPALRFPGDPVEFPDPVRFAFETTDGFRPVDADQLPDGRVIVLERRFTWLPPEFATRIVVADPADIVAGGTWRGRTIAEIADPVPEDNYEGLAAVPAADGAVDLWLVTDDNSNRLQRNLLLHLRIVTQNEKARENPARPSKQSAEGRSEPARTGRLRRPSRPS